MNAPIVAVIALASSLIGAGAASPPAPILDGFRADPDIRVFGSMYYVYPTSDKPNWQTTDFSVWKEERVSPCIRAND